MIVMGQESLFFSDLSNMTYFLLNHTKQLKINITVFMSLESIITKGNAMHCLVQYKIFWFFFQMKTLTVVQHLKK